MRLEIPDVVAELNSDIRLGNLYPARGGRRDKQWRLLIARKQSSMSDTCYFLEYDRYGNPAGVTQYGAHVVRDWVPQAHIELPDTLSGVWDY